MSVDTVHTCAIRTDQSSRLVMPSRHANQQPSCACCTISGQLTFSRPKIPTCSNMLEFFEQSRLSPIGQSGTVVEVVSMKIQEVHTYPTANRRHQTLNRLGNGRESAMCAFGITNSSPIVDRNSIPQITVPTNNSSQNTLPQVHPF